MKFKKILQKSLNYSLNESAASFKYYNDKGEITNDFKESDAEKTADEYIESLLKYVPDDLKKLASSNIRSGFPSTINSLKRLATSKEEIEKLDKILEMLMRKTSYKNIDGESSKEKTRQESGDRFEKAFGKKYEVTKTNFLVRAGSKKKKKNMAHSNITIKFKNTDSSPTHPSIFNFQNINVSSLEFDTSPQEFSLAKGDFFTDNEKLLTIESVEETKVPENEGGHIFELKKYSSDKINTGARILYSESKKVASRDQLIDYFGSQAQKQEWARIKSTYKNDSDDLKTEKEKAWKVISKSIRNEKKTEIINHNEIIVFLKDQAKNFIDNNKSIIIEGIKTDLGKRKWWFVFGEEKNFIFNEINVKKFVDNINLDTTNWQGIKRVRVTINKDIFEEENNIKKEIIYLAELIQTADLSAQTTIPPFQNQIQKLPYKASPQNLSATEEKFDADYEVTYEINADIQIPIF